MGDDPSRWIHPIMPHSRRTPTRGQVPTATFLALPRDTGGAGLEDPRRGNPARRARLTFGRMAIGKTGRERQQPGRIFSGRRGLWLRRVVHRRAPGHGLLPWPAIRGIQGRVRPAHQATSRILRGGACLARGTDFVGPTVGSRDPQQLALVCAEDTTRCRRSLAVGLDAFEVARGTPYCANFHHI